MKDNPTKTYALLSGNAGAPNLEQRITDVRAVLDLPENGLEYVTTLFCNDDSALGQQQMEDQLTATPDLGGFFLIGGWPLFADTAGMTQFLAKTAAGTLKCVAWDTLSMQLPLLENGTVQGLIGQKYFGWGYDGDRHHVRPRQVRHPAAAVHRLRLRPADDPRRCQGVRREVGDPELRAGRRLQVRPGQGRRVRGCSGRVTRVLTPGQPPGGMTRHM